MPARWNAQPEDLGGQIVGAPSAVSRTADNLDLFALGTDNCVWQRHARYEGLNWKWNDWARVDPTEVTSSPSADSRGSNHLQLFVRGTQGDVLTTSWTPDTGWRGYTSLAGIIRDSPAARTRANGTVTELFARGEDDFLWQTSLVPKEGGGAGWTSWKLVDDTLQFAEGPAVDSRAADHAHVFVRDPAGQVWTKWWDAARGWLDWKSLGGKIIGSPAARTQGDRTFVFGRGVDDLLWWNILGRVPSSPERFDWSDWGLLHPSDINGTSQPGFHLTSAPAADAADGRDEYTVGIVQVFYSDGGPVKDVTFRSVIE